MENLSDHILSLLLRGLFARILSLVPFDSALKAVLALNSIITDAFKLLFVYDKPNIWATKVLNAASKDLGGSKAS